MDTVFDLVVFLGNPGDQYARTRHNAARMLLEYIPGVNTLNWKDKFHGRIAEYGLGTSRTRFLIPETFMNISGKSVAAAINFFKFKLERVLIVHDEVELPFGRLAWRTGGGMGGHNGLKSIRDSIGSSDFSRLRIGIGRPSQGTVQSWVLGRFDPVEESALSIILNAAASQLTDALAGRSGVHETAESVTVYTSDSKMGGAR